MRCERAAADSGDVHDVAFDTARTQICEAVLADPVAPDSGNRRGRFVAHRYFSSWCIDRCARGGLVAVLQFDARCRSEEHTSELQSLMRISYAVFCLKKTTIQYTNYMLTLITT